MKKILMLGALLPVVGTGVGFGVGLKLMEPPHTPEAEQVAHEEPAAHESVMAKAEDAGHATPAPDSHDAKQGQALTPSHGKAGAFAGATPVAMHPESSDPARDSRNVVKVGSMMVPVSRAKSVTYVVADFGVAMPDSDTATHYRIAENSARLRDQILMSFREAAENAKMRRPELDSDWLSKEITKGVKNRFSDTKEVLFLSLYKRDVPRS